MVSTGHFNLQDMAKTIEIDTIETEYFDKEIRYQNGITTQNQNLRKYDENLLSNESIEKSPDFYGSP